MGFGFATKNIREDDYDSVQCCGDMHAWEHIGAQIGSKSYFKI